MSGFAASRDVSSARSCCEESPEVIWKRSVSSINGLALEKPGLNLIPTNLTVSGHESEAIGLGGSLAESVNSVGLQSEAGVLDFASSHTVAAFCKEDGQPQISLALCSRRLGQVGVGLRRLSSQFRSAQEQEGLLEGFLFNLSLPDDPGFYIENARIGSPREGCSDSIPGPRAIGISGVARSGAMVISNCDLIRWSSKQKCEGMVAIQWRRGNFPWLSGIIRLHPPP